MITECLLREITIEYLSARGEQPYRILRGGSSLWETHVPAMRLALVSALQSVEGGVRVSHDLRLRVALAIERADNVKVPDNYAAEIDHPEISDWNVYLADRAIEAMKSAPLIGAPHNSGGRLPIDKAESGADTKSEGGVQGRIATKQESCPESAPRTETAVAWAAWHPVKGFGPLPNACADIDDAVADAQCQTILDDSKEWKAVRVEIRRTR